jgi:putative membrane protein
MFARMLFTDTIRAHPKPLTALVTSLVFLATALPALAQQQEQAAGSVIWGWQPFMIVGMTVGPIFVALAIIGMMVIFVWLVRWATRGYPFYDQGIHHHPGRERAALDILDERFARGEIDKAEFEEKRKLLGR